MNIEIRSMHINELHAHPGNPRVTLQPGRDREFDAINTSLDRFGLVEPIVWNARTGHIVSGHQRVRVLRHRGVQHVDVSVVDLDEQEESALLLAMNKIEGRWDDTKLSDIIDDIDDPFALDLSAVDTTPAPSERRYLCDHCGTMWYE